jgi:hypothetical protein
MFMCQLYHALFINDARFLLLLFVYFVRYLILIHSLLRLLFSFNSLLSFTFIVHSSKEKDSFLILVF